MFMMNFPAHMNTIQLMNQLNEHLKKFGEGTDFFWDINTITNISIMKNGKTAILAFKNERDASLAFVLRHV